MELAVATLAVPCRISMKVLKEKKLNLFYIFKDMEMELGMRNNQSVA